MKKMIKIAFVAAFAAIAGYGVYANQKTDVMSDLALANIEALASGETAKCTDSCKEWSGNSGGGIACDCGRYTGKCKNRC